MRIPTPLLALVLAACSHAAAPSPPTASLDAGDRGDDVALCAAQRAENRARARSASRCAAAAECVPVGQYETGTCDAWVSGADVGSLRRQMRAAADAACGHAARVLVMPACPAAEAACVDGLCRGSSRAQGFAAVTGSVVQASPENDQCLADGLKRVADEKRLVMGRVELRFPLPAGGDPPRFFEAVGPHDPDTAVAVARVFGSCRWRLRGGGAIPSDVWGSLPIVLEE